MVSHYVGIGQPAEVMSSVEPDCPYFTSKASILLPHQQRSAQHALFEVTFGKTGVEKALGKARGIEPNAWLSRPSGAPYWKAQQV